MDPLSPQAIVELLRCAPLLAEVPREELAELVETVVIAEYGPGERIFSRGDPGDSMMIVAMGRVKITNNSASGKEFLFSVVEEGQIFGELAMIDGGRRSADFEARSQPMAWATTNRSTASP